MRLGAGARAAAFPAFSAPAAAFDDDLFLAHEAYIARASAELDELRPLLAAVDKRDALLADKVAYEAIIADAARLIKGSSAARLLEEKLERRVKKELPAFNKRLRADVAAFEAARGGAPFFVDGARLLDVLDGAEAAEAKAAKDARAHREARQRGEDVDGAAGAGAGAHAGAGAGAHAAADKARATSNPRASVAGAPRPSSAHAGAPRGAAKKAPAADAENAGAEEAAPRAGAGAGAGAAPLAAGAANKAAPARAPGKAAARPAAPAPQPLPACSAEAAEGAERMLQNL